jgi:hypothetical protein
MAWNASKREGSLEDGRNALGREAVHYVGAHARAHCLAYRFAGPVVREHHDGARAALRYGAEVFERVAARGVGIDDDRIGGESQRLIVELARIRDFRDDVVPEPLQHEAQVKRALGGVIDQHDA